MCGLRPKDDGITRRRACVRWEFSESLLVVKALIEGLTKMQRPVEKFQWMRLLKKSQGKSFTRL